MKTTIQDPADKPAGSENSLERGSFPAPGEDTEGGGAHPARTMPTPSAGGGSGVSGVSGAKGVMGGGRGSSGKYDGVIGGGDTTKHRGCMGD